MRTSKEFEQDMLPLAADIMEKAQHSGADAADVAIGEAVALSHSRRMGEAEGVERAESQEIGLRVFIQQGKAQKQAIVSGSDFSAQGITDMVARAVTMARHVPDDPYCGLAHKDEIMDMKSILDLDSEDVKEPSNETLIERAKIAEDKALSMPDIQNSEGAEASWALSRIALTTSNGFMGTKSSTRHGLSAYVIAANEDGMEGDYDYSSKVYGIDLEDPMAIGEKAAERARARLSPKRPKTKQLPIIFDQRIAPSLIQALASAINGQAIARKSSFLLDALETQIFPSHITISDDPLKPRGLASRAFDGEGLMTKKRTIIDKGFLTSWILDLRSARQLNLVSTGHAVRSIGSQPHPSVSNFTLHAGEMAPKKLYEDEGEVFMVTHLMGMGVNLVTGDYSQGASGFWIEKGEIIHAVNEATIAGNLKDMFLNLTPANNLEFKGSINAPTIRIDGMTLGA